MTEFRRMLGRVSFFPTAIALLQVVALTAVASTPIQEVLVYPQADSPLRIANVVPQWKVSADATWHLLDVVFLIENVSGKAIRAYSIRTHEGDFNRMSGSLTLTTLPTAERLIQPNQSRTENVGGIGFVVKPQALYISVDYVEFADGSSWGPDVFESAQRLCGQRAGAKAAIETLRTMRERSGIEDVIKALWKPLEIFPPEDQSDRWKEGFKSGVATVRLRVQNGYKVGGEAAALAALQRLFDAVPDQ